MFGLKKKTMAGAEQFAALMPKSVVSLAKLGDGALVEGIMVDFAFVLVEGSELQGFASVSGKAIRIATDHKAMVVENAGGLIQLAVGPRTDVQDCTEKRHDLVGELTRALGPSARIVHGRARSFVGTVGTEVRKNWGYFPNGMVQILQALVALSPGEVADLGDRLAE